MSKYQSGLHLLAAEQEAELNTLRAENERLWRERDAFRNLLEVSDDTKTCSILMLAENMLAENERLKKTFEGLPSKRGDIWQEAVVRTEWVYDGQPVVDGKEVVDYLLAEVRSLLSPDAALADLKGEGC